MFEEIKSVLGEDEEKDSNFIAPFPLLTKNAVESLRYRAEVKISQIPIFFEFIDINSVLMHTSATIMNEVDFLLLHCRPN